jgi:hypothetical protein
MHLPRSEAVGGNLVTFDSDNPQRLFHELTLSQTVTNLQSEFIYSGKRVEARGV